MQKTRSDPRRLRRIGLVWILAALVTAGVMYRLRTSDDDLSVDDVVPGTSAADARQMGILYGKTGARVMGWVEDLQRPDVDAAIIVLVGLIAGGLCFHVARLTPHDAMQETRSDPKIQA